MGRRITQFYQASREERTDYEHGEGFGYGYEWYPGLAQQDPFAKIFPPKVNEEGEWASDKGGPGHSQIRNYFSDANRIYCVYRSKRSSSRFIWARMVYWWSKPEECFGSGDEVTVTGSWINQREWTLLDLN